MDWDGSFIADDELGGCKHVRDPEGKASRSDLLKHLRASLRYEGYDQAPQMEGAAEAKKKPLFA